MNGFLNIYKSYGVSSFHYISLLRRYLDIKKIGHAGTLDPAAEGVLVIAVGHATKVVDFITNTKKEYIFTVKFGVQTDSGDIEGNVIKCAPVLIKQEDVYNICKNFIGTIEQTPSQYSAIKINGQRAYKLARAGKDFKIPSRKINIYELECIKYDSENLCASYRVVCSKGTYIRTLAEDISLSLKTVGFVIELRRTFSGSFNYQNAVCLDKFRFCKDKKYIKQYLSHNIISIDKVLEDKLVYDVDYDIAKLVSNGRYVELPLVADDVVFLKYNGNVFAFGKFVDGLFKPSKILYNIF